MKGMWWVVSLAALTADCSACEWVGHSVVMTAVQKADCWADITAVKWESKQADRKAD
jgi:hypothetical protein